MQRIGLVVGWRRSSNAFLVRFDRRPPAHTFVHHRLAFGFDTETAEDYATGTFDVRQVMPIGLNAEPIFELTTDKVVSVMPERLIGATVYTL